MQVQGNARQVLVQRRQCKKAGAGVCAGGAGVSVGAGGAGVKV